VRFILPQNKGKSEEKISDSYIEETRYLIAELIIFGQKRINRIVRK